MKFIFGFLVPPESVPRRMTILVTVFPVLVFLSLRLFQSFSFSFLVPPESVPGRMTILVTVFLVLVNIFNSITSNIPKVFISKILTICILICICIYFFICISICICQHLQQYHQQHPKGFHISCFLTIIITLN